MTIQSIQQDILAGAEKRMNEERARMELAASFLMWTTQQLGECKAKYKRACEEYNEMKACYESYIGEE